MTDSQYIIDIDASNFEQVVLHGSQETPILVDFWAPWCEPCKTLTPLLEKLANEYQGKFILAKINTEEHQELAAQFGIRSIPSVKLIHQGQLLDEFSGTIPEQELRSFLEKHISNDLEADPFSTQINQLVNTGQFDEALELLNNTPDEATLPTDMILMHAKLLSQKGDVEAAKAKLGEIADDDQGNQEVASFKAKLGFVDLIKDAPEPNILQERLSQTPEDSEAGYQLAAHAVLQNQYEYALKLLFDIMRRDRKYGDDAARKAMLMIFDILGSEHPATNEYRKQMFNYLH